MGLSPLPPWDANSYFQMPEMEFISLPSGVVTQLAAADQHRVALLLRTIDPQTISVGPRTDLLLSRGWLLTQSNPVLELYHYRVGPLVALAWFALQTSGLTITVPVLAVSLREWPKGGQGYADGQQPGYEDGDVRGGGDASGRGPAAGEYRPLAWPDQSLYR